MGGWACSTGAPWGSYFQAACCWGSANPSGRSSPPRPARCPHLGFQPWAHDGDLGLGLPIHGAAWEGPWRLRQAPSKLSWVSPRPGVPPFHPRPPALSAAGDGWFATLPDSTVCDDDPLTGLKCTPFSG